MATNYALGNILTGIEAGIAKMGKTPDTVTSSDLGMADRECTCSATPLSAAVVVSCFRRLVLG
jgi:hypothetical protein